MKFREYTIDDFEVDSMSEVAQIMLINHIENMNKLIRLLNSEYATTEHKEKILADIAMLTPISCKAI